MKFEWDDNKNNKNIEKHGIDFSDATEAFKNPIIEKVDDRKDYGETRWIALAYLVKFVVVIVYTIRKGVYRLISVRKAKSKETAYYHENTE